MADKKEVKLTKTTHVVAGEVTDGPKKPELPHRLKKALTATVELGTEITEVKEEKGPTVIIAGMRLEPIATGLKPNGSSGDVYVHEGQEFWIPHHVIYSPHHRKSNSDDAPWEVGTSYNAPEMSLFVFVYDNEKYYLLLDGHSSFIRDKDEYFNRTKGGRLILINAKSHNDQFIGHAALVNVESKNNLLNKSNIIVNSASVGRERGWGSRGPFVQGSKRHQYENLRLKESDCVDSDMTKGNYSNVTFIKSSCIGTGTWDNDVMDTSLSESRFYGSRVSLNGLRVGDTLDISSGGEISISGIHSLKNQDWNFPSIYITNRFAFTEIDFITRQDRGIRMVRTSKTDVELSIQLWKEPVKLSITATRPEIEGLLRTALESGKEKKDVVPPLNGPFGYALQPAYVSPFAIPKPGESVKSFVLQYLVDQVSSRLGMIQMLDEVEETVDELRGPRSARGTRHADFFE